MSRRKLTVIDDEPDMGEFVCAVAEGAGFEARCVQHAGEFMASVDQPVDVLVLDLFMPEVDGIELIRFLHENEFEAPVVLDILVRGRAIHVRKAGREDQEEAELELVHEALIQSWHRLSRWIDGSREEMACL